MELVCLGTYSNYQQEASKSILNGFIDVWLNLVTSAVLYPCIPIYHTTGLIVTIWN